MHLRNCCLLDISRLLTKILTKIGYIKNQIVLDFIMYVLLAY